MADLVITICEGPHDVAFLYKILRCRGLKPYSKKIEEMPELLKEYFIRKMTKHNYEDVKLENIKPPLPTILSKGALYYLLYPVGGDSKVKEAQTIINDFIISKRNAWMSKDETPYNYAFSFFYDADKRGKEHRVDNIKRNFSRLLGDLEKLGHNQIISTDSGSVGCFIFTQDGDTGRLEDIILPLMQEGKENKEIFKDANLYIEKHFDAKRLKRKDHFDKKKALIGIAGQLQRSGCTNTVVIQHTDYLSKEKIERNPQCKAICAFFDKFQYFGK